MTKMKKIVFKHFKTIMTNNFSLNNAEYKDVYKIVKHKVDPRNLKKVYAKEAIQEKSAIKLAEALNVKLFELTGDPQDQDQMQGHGSKKKEDKKKSDELKDNNQKQQERIWRNITKEAMVLLSIIVEQNSLRLEFSPNPTSIPALKAAAIVAEASGTYWVGKGPMQDITTNEMAERFRFAAELQEALNILKKEDYETLITIDPILPRILKLTTESKLKEKK